MLPTTPRRCKWMLVVSAEATTAPASIAQECCSVKPCWTNAESARAAPPERSLDRLSTVREYAQAPQGMIAAECVQAAVQAERLMPTRTASGYALAVAQNCVVNASI